MLPWSSTAPVSYTHLDVYKRQVVKNTLARLDGKRPVLASNAVGGESALRLMDMLAPGGRMVKYLSLIHI